jgi:hypothetical protein
MRNFEKIAIGTVVDILNNYETDIYCEDFINKPYDVFQGILHFENDTSCAKVKELNLAKNDKVKIGVYKAAPEDIFYEVPDSYDESELYVYDIIEKIK